MRIKNYIFRCEICLKIFDRTRAYQRHLKTHKPKSEVSENKFSCLQCPKKFFSEIKLKIHEEVHSPNSAKVHPCPYCDKKFTRSVTVQAHVKSIHQGERQFM